MRAILFGALLACSAALQAAEILVLSSTALKSTLEALGPGFEKQTGHKLMMLFGPAAELKGRIDKGERYDVAVLTAPLMDQLAKDSRIAAASRIDVARSGIGVAYRKGAAKPDVSTADALKKALLS